MIAAFVLLTLLAVATGFVMGRLSAFYQYSEAMSGLELIARHDRAADEWIRRQAAPRSAPRPAPAHVPRHRFTDRPIWWVERDELVGSAA